MPRLNVEISDDLDQELDKFLPWGTRSEIVRVLLHQLVETAKADGFSAIELILTNRRSLTDPLIRR